jgi:alkyl hydroperoxide reductase subunit AhpF
MNIEYEEMVVTFIDILGFKKLIESENIEEVRKIIDRFNGFKNLSMLCHKTGDPNNDAFNSISASDAIIRLTRFPENYNKEQIIIKEIEVLASIQLKLICDHKILIRGGLSIGKMYFNYK